MASFTFKRFTCSSQVVTITMESSSGLANRDHVSTMSFNLHNVDKIQFPLKTGA